MWNFSAWKDCCCEEFSERVKENAERIHSLDPRSHEAVANALNAKEESFRESLWRAFENPQRNSISLTIYYVTGFFILVSVLANICETIPWAKEDVLQPGGHYTISIVMLTFGDKFKHAFLVIDTACVIIFTVEYLLRMFGAPNRCKFVRSTMSIIDIAAIFPSYISLFLGEQSQFGGAFTTLRVLRVFRIFKFSRHSSGLRILGYTLQSCASELGFLVFSLAMAVVIFSTLIYYCEKSQPKTQFISIPDSFWWVQV